MASNAIPIGIMTLNTVTTLISFYLVLYTYKRAYRYQLANKDHQFYILKLQKCVMFFFINLLSVYVSFRFFATMRIEVPRDLNFIRYVNSALIFFYAWYKYLDCTRYYPSAYDKGKNKINESQKCCDHEKLSFLLLFLITACNPVRHYQKVAEDKDRTERKRAILAPVCSEEFPVKSSTDSVLMVDSVIIHDTTTNTVINEVLKPYFKDCPQLNIDSITQQIKSRIKPDVIKTQTTKVITTVKADSAALYVFSEKLNKANKENEQLTADLSKSRKKQKTFFWLFIASLVTLGLSHWIRSKLF